MIYSNIIWVSHIIDTFILKYKIHKKHNIKMMQNYTFQQIDAFQQLHSTKTP